MTIASSGQASSQSPQNMQRDISMSKASGKRSMPESLSSPGTIVMQSVGHANSQRPHATEGVGIVDALFGILHHEGRALSRSEPSQVSEEVTARDPETLHDRRYIEALYPTGMRPTVHSDDSPGHRRA